MNVSLTPELEKFVKKEVDTGLYQTASEVIRAGLRKLKDEKPRPLRKLPTTMEELEDDIAASIACIERGEGVKGEEAFRRFQKKIKARSRG